MILIGAMMELEILKIKNHIFNKGKFVLTRVKKLQRDNINQDKNIII